MTTLCPPLLSRNACMSTVAWDTASSQLRGGGSPPWDNSLSNTIPAPLLGVLGLPCPVPVLRLSPIRSFSSGALKCQSTGSDLMRWIITVSVKPMHEKANTLWRIRAYIHGLGWCFVLRQYCCYEWLCSNSLWKKSKWWHCCPRLLAVVPVFRSHNGRVSFRFHWRSGDKIRAHSILIEITLLCFIVIGSTSTLKTRQREGLNFGHLGEKKLFDGTFRPKHEKSPPCKRKVRWGLQKNNIAALSLTRRWELKCLKKNNWEKKLNPANLCFNRWLNTKTDNLRAPQTLWALIK